MDAGPTKTRNLRSGLFDETSRATLDFATVTERSQPSSLFWQLAGIAETLGRVGDGGGTSVPHMVDAMHGTLTDLAAAPGLSAHVVLPAGWAGASRGEWEFLGVIHDTCKNWEIRAIRSFKVRLAGTPPVQPVGAWKKQ